MGESNCVLAEIGFASAYVHPLARAFGEVAEEERDLAAVLIVIFAGSDWNAVGALVHPRWGVQTFTARVCCKRGFRVFCPGFGLRG